MQLIMRRVVTILLLQVLFPILSHGQPSNAFPSFASAVQNPVWIDLSGSWQMTFEDRPVFAQPAYDDHAWQSLTLPGGLPAVRSGVHLRGWMRRRVELPPGTDCTHLALTLGVITQSRYEVWLNGQRLPSSESVDPADTRIPRPITHLIPPCTMPYPHSLVVAIHFASFDMHPDWRLPDQGPYLLTNLVNAPVDVGGRALAAQRDRIAPTQIFTIAIFLMLAALCLVVWSTDPARTEFTLVCARSGGTHCVLGMRSRRPLSLGVCVARAPQLHWRIHRAPNSRRGRLLRPGHQAQTLASCCELAGRNSDGVVHPRLVLIQFRGSVLHWVRNSRRRHHWLQLVATAKLPSICRRSFAARHPAPAWSSNRDLLDRLHERYCPVRFWGYRLGQLAYLPLRCELVRRRIGYLRHPDASNTC